MISIDGGTFIAEIIIFYIKDLLQSLFDPFSKRSQLSFKPDYAIFKQNVLFSRT